MTWGRAIAACILVGCGGIVATPGDAGSPDAADTGSDSTLAACAHACVGATSNDCPVLLLYDCLRASCGDNASTAICEAGDGTPAPLATIQCARATFPTCPSASCQGSQTCEAFVACIEACH